MENKTLPSKAQIVASLDAWIRQRPGLEFGNYGDVAAYRSELRGITKDLHDARAMLAYVAGRDSITAERLAESFRDSYSGRLSLKPHASKPDAWTLSYCTGQYWPTEYRRAACAVLASAIFGWLRDECTPAPDAYRVTRNAWNGRAWIDEVHATHTGRDAQELAEDSARALNRTELDAWHAAGRLNGMPTGGWHAAAVYRDGKSKGDVIRASARRELGASIARRWFN